MTYPPQFKNSQMTADEREEAAARSALKTGWTVDYYTNSGEILTKPGVKFYEIQTAILQLSADALQYDMECDRIVIWDTESSVSERPPTPKKGKPDLTYEDVSRELNR